MSNRLLQHSILLMAATQIGNLANVLFQAFMMRRLPDVEYGALAAMMGLITIVATPLDALRTAAAHATAVLRREDRADAAAPLLRRWSRKMVPPAVALLLMGCLTAPYAAAWFKLPGAPLIIVTTAVMACSIFMPAPAGALQGMESFGWLSALAPVWGITRLVIGVVLVTGIAATAVMGLTAQICGIGVTIAVSVWGLRRVLPAAGTVQPPIQTGATRTYLFGAFATLLGLAVLMNVDVALVKIFFPPETAGRFARAANIARLVIFLPMPIAYAMFPKIVAATESTKQRATFRQALIYTAGLIGAAAAGCSVLAGLLWRIFAGVPGTPEELLLIRQLLWAMAPLGMVYLLVNFEMAKSRFRAAGWLALIAAGYITGVTFFHQTLTQIIVVLAVASYTAPLVLGVMMHKDQPRQP